MRIKQIFIVADIEAIEDELNQCCTEFGLLEWIKHFDKYLGEYATIYGQQAFADLLNSSGIDPRQYYVKNYIIDGDSNFHTDRNFVDNQGYIDFSRFTINKEDEIKPSNESDNIISDV